MAGEIAYYEPPDGRKRPLEEPPSRVSTDEPKNKSIRAFFVKKATSAVVKPTFDKTTWIKGLSNEEQSLLKLELDTLDSSWLSVLAPELTKSYFLSLKRFLQSEQNSNKIFPPPKDIYSWSRLCPLPNCKVVILGQDPYHNFNQAHGLAFSVKPPTPAPPSLKNIYKELETSYPDKFKTPVSGNLEAWASQGVLLLNTCLTVRAHEANSHSKHGWESFTEQVLKTAIKNRPRGICFLVWGSPAAKVVDRILPPSNKSNHLVLRSVHPSPLSAARGFFGCDHFRKANAWLSQNYGADAVIDWTAISSS